MGGAGEARRCDRRALIRFRVGRFAPAKAVELAGGHRVGVAAGDGALAWLLLQKPSADVRPVVQPGRVEAHAHALAVALVEQADPVDAEVAHPEPAVADGAGGEHLHGVGQGALAASTIMQPMTTPGAA